MGRVQLAQSVKLLHAGGGGGGVAVSQNWCPVASILHTVYGAVVHGLGWHLSTHRKVVVDGPSRTQYCARLQGLGWQGLSTGQASGLGSGLNCSVLAAHWKPKTKRRLRQCSAVRT